ncbi:hypothetical protein [Paraconexibacter sp. AEG42_29]|uniref:hypothetical protein n=1 Tax=Paraconexibacter sp. AEG42_29 TaxID=2997339 RepID=UPI00339D5077
MAASIDPLALLRRQAAVTGRGACTDGERIAARDAARELRAIGRRGVRTQTVWVRPAGPLVAALLGLVAVVASVVAVDHPRTGAIAALAALVLLIGDLSGRAPLVRRLTYARATQNVISTGGRPDAPVRLIVTAALDTPRGGILDSGGATARAVARLRAGLGGHLPGRHGALLLGVAGLAAGCVARERGAEAAWLDVAQLLPTVALLALTGLLADAGLTRAGRHGAGANAAAAAVALGLVAALDRRPPRALAVDLVLAGAGEADAAGLQRWIAAQRREGMQARDVAVLHIAACGHGRPVWWTREGSVVPLAYHPQLTAIAARAATRERHLGARPHQSRRTTGGRVARAAGWPAIAVGALERGVVPHAGRDSDTPDAVDPRAVAAVLELALAIVAGLDAEITGRA